MNKSHLRIATIASFIIVTLAIQTFFSVSHAAKKNMYYWSGYQQAISSANDTAERVKTSEASLLGLIEKSDAAGRKIAPGVLGEYGYFFFERGEFDTAIYWFEREIGAWPESAVLMKKMIARARAGSAS